MTDLPQIILPKGFSKVYEWKHLKYRRLELRKQLNRISFLLNLQDDMNLDFFNGILHRLDILNAIIDEHDL